MSGSREGWLLLKHHEPEAEARWYHGGQGRTQPLALMQGSPGSSTGGQSEVLSLKWVYSDEADQKGFESGSAPAMITRVRHSPAITRQVHSDKGKVKLGYETPGLGSGSTRSMARHRWVLLRYSSGQD